jgi:hypothetical protein
MNVGAVFVPSRLASRADAYHAVRSQHRKTNIAVRKLEVDWPGASELINGMCDYLTEAICVNNESVIFSTVREALHAYDATVADCRHDRIRLDRFLEALVVPLAGHLEGLGVSDRAAGAVWRPDLGQPMRDWLATDQRLERLEQLVIIETDAEMCDIVEAMVENTSLPVDRLMEVC